jgi:hypothetical protein
VYLYILIGIISEKKMHKKKIVKLNAKTAHEYKTFNYKGDTKQEVLIEKSG